MKMKIRPKDYYDFLPPNFHRTGDIWIKIPNMGVFSGKLTTGVVVTPACDLAQKKTPTITCLPIVTIEEYVNSSGFYADLWQEIYQILEKNKLHLDILTPDRFELPILDELISAREKFNKIVETDSSKITQFNRFKSYLQHIVNVGQGVLSPIAQIEAVFSKGNFEKILRKVATNSYKVDMHFLPCDEKSGESAMLVKHSVILFRFAQSFPVEIFDSAQYCDSDWDKRIVELNEKNCNASNFPVAPVRMATIRDDFLSDMLSRYVSMQIRLGSRDFTEDSIETYVDQIRSVA